MKLLPREHGAYVQLLAPLTLALALSNGGAVAILLTLAAILAFVANEPLLVLLGHRGKRLREQASSRAVGMLAILAPLVVVIGVVALVLATASTRLVAVLVGLPAALLVGLGVAKKQRSLFGEAVAVIALTGAAAPVAVAGGTSVPDALALWGAWALGFGCSTIVVHRVIERGKGRRGLADVALAFLFLCIACAAWIATRKLYAFHVALPLTSAAAIVSWISPRPAKLRAIGFAMLGASLIAIFATLVLRA
jgi:hypothetical protein